MTNFRINVVSDTVCPWCYVGRKQLQTAQAIWQRQRPENQADTFTVTYSPFQLQPAWPRGPGFSRDKIQFYHDKFGAERTTMMQQRLRAIGEAVGIHFKFGGSVGNTRDSHRLVQLAKKYGSETELRAIDGLFAAYFENEKDIADYAVLAEVAAGAGIPEAEFRKAIVESDEGGPEVDNEVARATANGVPDFTIQGRFKLSGSQDPEEFISVFDVIKKQEAAGSA